MAHNSLIRRGGITLGRAFNSDRGPNANSVRTRGRIQIAKNATVQIASLAVKPNEMVQGSGRNPENDFRCEVVARPMG